MLTTGSASPFRYGYILRWYLSLISRWYSNIYSFFLFLWRLFCKRKAFSLYKWNYLHNSFWKKSLVFHSQGKISVLDNSAYIFFSNMIYFILLQWLLLFLKIEVFLKPSWLFYIFQTNSPSHNNDIEFILACILWRVWSLEPQNFLKLTEQCCLLSPQTCTAVFWVEERSPGFSPKSKTKAMFFTWKLLCVCKHHILAWNVEQSMESNKGFANLIGNNKKI